VTTWLKRALVLAIALTLINDVGRYLVASYRLTERSRAMAFEAARVAKADLSSNSGWPAAQKIAADAGIEVIGYEQSQQNATVVTRISITGTWVLGPVYAFMTRQPLSKPFTIDNRTTQSG
jgi:hypothetical protein